MVIVVVIISKEGTMREEWKGGHLLGFGGRLQKSRADKFLRKSNESVSGLVLGRCAHFHCFHYPWTLSVRG